MSKHTDFYVGFFSKWHESNKKYGFVPEEDEAMQAVENIHIGSEYCWMHSPGGWCCKECWIQGNLAAFFAGVGEYAMLYQVWVELEAVPSYFERYKREVEDVKRLS